MQKITVELITKCIIEWQMRPRVWEKLQEGSTIALRLSSHAGKLMRHNGKNMKREGICICDKSSIKPQSKRPVYTL